MTYEWEMQRIEPIWLLDLTWLIDFTVLVVLTHTQTFSRNLLS